MADVVPPELLRLLSAADEDDVETAWSAFLSVHNPLLLRVVRSLRVEYDEGMDAYACILEKLREEHFRCLGDYKVDARSSFSTWLAVVARRIGLDHLRHRYGRIERSDEKAVERQAARRRLADLVSSRVDIELLPQARSGNPERGFEEKELLISLENAVAELTAEEHLLVVLRFYDGLTAAEIASMLQLPSAFHVYRRLNLVLKKLRHFLVERGVERSDG